VIAARLHEHGKPLVVEEVELPTPQAGEVVVDLEYGGVNPVDRYNALGRVAAAGPLPRTLGGEAAGRLDGRSVVVAGEGLGSTRDGVWATRAVVPRTAVVELPEGVDSRDAAAVGIAGLTAWKVVRELARVGRDDRVLVLGASGGVGSIIVSLARAAGATVWGQTGSPHKAQLIQEQGAERALVGDAEELGPAFSEFEPTVVLDPLGGGFVAPSVDALTVRGRYVSFGTSAGAMVTFNLQTLYRKMATLYGYGGMQLTTEERLEGLPKALRALRDGELRPRIDDVLALEQVNEAFGRLEERQVQGKLLLRLGTASRPESR
jgi:NADPH2:quinone reductase